MINPNFYDKNRNWRSRIAAIAPLLKSGTQQWVRGFESHLLRNMNYKNIILLVIIAVILISGGISFYYYRSNIINNNQQATEKQQEKTITLEDQKIADNTSPFKINIVYPTIAGLDDFNQKSKAIVDKEISDFKTNSLANDEAVKKVDPVDYAKYPREYELDIGYDKGETNSGIVSVIFNVYNFEGGAHGASYFVPLNYDLQSKQEIKLANLFPGETNYLQKISDYCIEDLKKQITTKLGSTDGTYIQDGAGPNDDNFQYFLINSDNTITFYFPQYQVAFGAAGSFKVVMPR